MNRQEAVKERRRLRPDVPQKIAAGAVALCVGCPLAAICPTKAPGECPFDLAEQLIDDGDYAPPIKTSYLQDLLDDSKPTVMANLVRKPLPPSRPVKAKPPTKPPVQTPVAKPVPIRKKQPKQPPKLRLSYPHEQVGEAIADIFYALFSVDSLASSRKR